MFVGGITRGKCVPCWQRRRGRGRSVGPRRRSCEFIARERIGDEDGVTNIATTAQSTDIAPDTTTLLGALQSTSVQHRRSLPERAYQPQLTSHIIHGLLCLILILKYRLVSDGEVHARFFHAIETISHCTITVGPWRLNYPMASR